jgi:hypothetical protein
MLFDDQICGPLVEANPQLNIAIQGADVGFPARRFDEVTGWH